MAGEGSFVQTTQVWDVSDIQSMDVTGAEFKELVVRMYQNINEIAIVLNTKDTGYYPLFEIVNSQLWFPDPALTSGTTPQPSYRQVVRKVINFGALPDTANQAIAHGIVFTDASRVTRIYGVAIDPVNHIYLPLPYASPTDANNIELWADNANVNVTTGADLTAYTVCYIVIEYIKR
jgi:hypothetical protein